MSERLTHLEFKSRVGEIRTTIYSDGGVNLTFWNPITITACLTLEDARTLIGNLESIIATYEATVDHYHDQCDEPAVSAEEQ